MRETETLQRMHDDQNVGHADNLAHTPVGTLYPLQELCLSQLS